MKCMIDNCFEEAFTEVEVVEQINNEDSDRKYKIKICDKCLIGVYDEERSHHTSNELLK